MGVRGADLAGRREELVCMKIPRNDANEVGENEVTVTIFVVSKS